MRATLLLLGLLAGPALASGADGVIEINQTRADAGGVTPGDGPGFPVSITAPGSYRLTGNLVVDDVSTTAIRISVSNVSLDLGGFVIRGPVGCSGTPTTCTPAGGSGRGILAAPSAGALENVAVRGGVVSGMGAAGVQLQAAGARVEAMRVLGNGGAGISVDAGSRVTGCVVGRKGGDGVVLGDASLAAENVVTANGASGIQLDGPGAAAEHNAIARNGQRGVLGGPASDALLVRGNTVFDNASVGIELRGNGATIADNSLASNGTGAFNQPSILCGAGCNVDGNLVTGGSGYGLELGANSAYRDNSLIDNGAPVTGTGIERGGNLCTTAGAVVACP
jgi:parallel beta-helix repeat protein